MSMAKVFLFDAASLCDRLYDGGHFQTRDQSLCSCVLIGPRLLRDDLPHFLDPLGAAEVDLAGQFFPI